MSFTTLIIQTSLEIISFLFCLIKLTLFCKLNYNIKFDPHIYLKLTLIQKKKTVNRLKLITKNVYKVNVSNIYCF